MKIGRTTLVKAAAAAGIALAAMGSASVAQARVFVSVGANIAPGVSVGVSNGGYGGYGGYYQQPVYVQPAPVYYQPAPVYYEPEPVYYQPQTYYAPAPAYYAPPVFGVTYVRSWGGNRHRHHGHGYYR